MTHKTTYFFSLIFMVISAWINQPVLGSTQFEESSEGMRFQVELVKENLGIPWGMAFLDSSHLIFTEREGRIGILTPETAKVIYLSGSPRVLDKGQGGMLDVAVPKNHTKGGWIYFTYSKKVKGIGVTTLARAKHDKSRIRQWEDLLITQSESNTNRHYGSRIAFDDKGYLYFTVGERGNRPNAQDLSTHSGSVLRLKIDGTQPEDNPFMNTPGALPEIWSYGHRNPQGIVFDSIHNRLWANEHGPRGGDEINLILPGNNYGWPVISYGKEYWGPVPVGESTKKQGMEQPVKFYDPSIAPGSLLLYTGKAFPKWKGNLFSGALKMKHLNRVSLDDSGKSISEERLLLDLKRRIRSLAESPEGWIYISTDQGEILRLKPEKER